jgi:hypothetical protein
MQAFLKLFAKLQWQEHKKTDANKFFEIHEGVQINIRRVMLF